MTLVLDAEALSRLARALPSRSGPGNVLDALVAAYERGDSVVVPAAVLSELYRGGGHDQVVDSRPGRFPGVAVVDTTRELARSIGNLLARAGRGSADHVDAAVVATAAQAGGGVIATGDVDDIVAISDGLPRIRVQTV